MESSSTSKINAINITKTKIHNRHEYGSETKEITRKESICYIWTRFGIMVSPFAFNWHHTLCTYSQHCTLNITLNKLQNSYFLIKFVLKTTVEIHKFVLKTTTFDLNFKIKRKCKNHWIWYWYIRLHREYSPYPHSHIQHLNPSNIRPSRIIITIYPNSTDTGHRIIDLISNMHRSVSLHLFLWLLLLSCNHFRLWLITWSIRTADGTDHIFPRGIRHLLLLNPLHRGFRELISLLFPRLFVRFQENITIRFIVTNPWRW